MCCTPQCCLERYACAFSPNVYKHCTDPGCCGVCYAPKGDAKERYVAVWTAGLRSGGAGMPVGNGVLCGLV